MQTTKTTGADGPNGFAAAAERSGTWAFSPFEWMLSLRYLRARRKEGFVSVIAGFSFLGIMLGVATLIIVMAVMNGFRADLVSKILGLNGHVIVHKIGVPFEDYERVAQQIESVEGVKYALPLIEGQVMASTPAQATFATVRGMTGAGMTSLKLVSDNIQFGTLSAWDAERSIAIGSRMANALRVTVGDVITLATARGAQTPFGTTPRSRPYKVSAIFEMGMSEYDRVMLFMPLAEAQRYFSKPGRVDVLEVVTDDAEKVDDYIGPIRDAGGQTTHVTDWRERNSTFFTVLEVERNVMFIILSLIILVAALNIVSGMIMLVKDKSRDIAILRTMGATRGSMMRVFLITGASIGIVGTFAGLILGIIFTNNIEAVRQFVAWVSNTQVFDPSVYYLNKLPALINPWETASIVLMALVISVLATLYPSWRAATLDPVEALRYE